MARNYQQSLSNIVHTVPGLVATGGGGARATDQAGSSGLGAHTDFHLEQIEKLRELLQASQAELSRERAAKRKAEDEIDKERALRRKLEDDVWEMKVQGKVSP